MSGPAKLRLREAIERDPWIANIGLKLERTNVVSLKSFKWWRANNGLIPGIGLVLRASLDAVAVRKLARAQRTLARRLEKVDALARRERELARKAGTP